MTFVERNSCQFALDYASGTADRNGDSVDMKGYGIATFVLHLATAAASSAHTAKVQGSADGSSWSDLEGTGQSIVEADSDNVKMFCVPYPRHRYLRLVIDKDGSNACAESAVCFLSEAYSEPVSHATNIDSETHHAPAAGAA